MINQKSDEAIIKVSSPDKQITEATAETVAKTFRVVSRSKLKQGTKTKFDLSDPLYFIFFTVKHRNGDP